MGGRYQPRMPVLCLKGQKLNLKVEWKGQAYPVLCVLQQRPIAIVLLVQWDDATRRVIKLYPRVTEKCLYRNGFQCESAAYRIFRQASLQVVPRYHGSCHSTKLLYPPESVIPIEDRVVGMQRAIMLQYLEGQLVMPYNDNFTALVAEKSLHALQLIHDLGVCHGDVYRDRSIRNLMLLHNGDVAWIDFEHSEKGEDAHQWLSLEKELVEELLGKSSHSYRSMHYRDPLSEAPSQTLPSTTFIPKLHNENEPFFETKGTEEEYEIRSSRTQYTTHHLFYVLVLSVLAIILFFLHQPLLRLEHWS